MGGVPLHEGGGAPQNPISGYGDVVSIEKCGSGGEADMLSFAGWWVDVGGTRVRERGGW